MNDPTKMMVFRAPFVVTLYVCAFTNNMPAFTGLIRSILRFGVVTTIFKLRDGVYRNSRTRVIVMLIICTST